MVMRGCQVLYERWAGFGSACSVCSVFKIRGAAEKDLVFLTEGGFLIKNTYVC